MSNNSDQQWTNFKLNLLNLTDLVTKNQFYLYLDNSIMESTWGLSNNSSRLVIGIRKFKAFNFQSTFEFGYPEIVSFIDNYKKYFHENITKILDKHLSAAGLTTTGVFKFQIVKVNYKQRKEIKFAIAGDKNGNIVIHIEIKNPTNSSCPVMSVCLTPFQAKNMFLLFQEVRDNYLSLSSNYINICNQNRILNKVENIKNEFYNKLDELLVKNVSLINDNINQNSLGLQQNINGLFTRGIEALKQINTTPQILPKLDIVDGNSDNNDVSDYELDNDFDDNIENPSEFPFDFPEDSTTNIEDIIPISDEDIITELQEDVTEENEIDENSISDIADENITTELQEDDQELDISDDNIIDSSQDFNIDDVIDNDETDIEDINSIQENFQNQFNINDIEIEVPEIPKENNDKKNNKIIEDTPQQFKVTKNQTGNNFIDNYLSKDLQSIFEIYTSVATLNPHSRLELFNPYKILMERTGISYEEMQLIENDKNIMFYQFFTLFIVKLSRKIVLGPNPKDFSPPSLILFDEKIDKNEHKKLYEMIIGIIYVFIILGLYIKKKIKDGEKTNHSMYCIYYSYLNFIKYLLFPYINMLKKEDLENEELEEEFIRIHKSCIECGALNNITMFIEKEFKIKLDWSLDNILQEYKNFVELINKVWDSKDSIRLLPNSNNTLSIYKYANLPVENIKYESLEDIRFSVMDYMGLSYEIPQPIDLTNKERYKMFLELSKKYITNSEKFEYLKNNISSYDTIVEFLNKNNESIPYQLWYIKRILDMKPINVSKNRKAIEELIDHYLSTENLPDTRFRVMMDNMNDNVELTPEEQQFYDYYFFNKQ